MYQNTDIKYKYFFDINNIFSLNNFLKVFTFYFLMLLIYLSIFLYIGPVYVSFENFYEFNAMMQFWIAIFSPIILIFPILYTSYVLGGEAKSNFSTKCLISLIRLVLLYGFVLVFYLPSFIILYEIAPAASDSGVTVNTKILIFFMIIIILAIYPVAISILYKKFPSNKTQKKQQIETKVETLNEKISHFSWSNEWKFVGLFYYLSMLITLAILFLDNIFLPPPEINNLTFAQSFFLQFSIAFILLIILIYLIFPLPYNLYKYKVYQHSKKILLVRIFITYFPSSILIWFLYIISNVIYTSDLRIIPILGIAWIGIGILFLAFLYRTKVIHFYQRYFNIIDRLFYHKILHILQNSEPAEFFAKQFIILQTEAIKEMLPRATLKTLKPLFRTILIADILRLQKMYEFNNIPAKSTKAVLDYVMEISSPLIINLELALRQHLTEQLLKRHDPATVQADINVLWPIVNKVLLQWESVTDKFYLSNT